MVGVLTVSSSASPFPYAAVVIATLTQKAEVNFDEGSSGISLNLNGSTLTDEVEVVHALAKAGGLAEDSAKVIEARLPKPHTWLRPRIVSDVYQYCQEAFCFDISTRDYWRSRYSR
jgi:hypothetical protein